MELPIATTATASILRRLSSASLCPQHSSGHTFKFRRQFPWRRRLKCRLKSKHQRIGSSIDGESSVSSSSSPLMNEEDFENLWEDTEIVEVIGIGSRKDAVLDFCLRSPSLSPRLRLWNIIVEETSKVQLQQRFLGDDITKTVVDAPLTMRSRSKAVILVAGASYGSDHTTVLDILEAIKLANGFVVAIILKPFRFEGRRRQEEVKDLLYKFQGLMDLCIMVDADALLEKDFVTLDEALQTANNAVLMALNAISILTSELNIKFLDIPHDNIVELGVTDLKRILGSYKEARIGYGVGYNVETSVARAVYDCPFLGSGVKDLHGIVVFILATSTVIDGNDVHGILHKFRQATEWEGDIITSVVHEPDLGSNLIATTIFTIGCIRRGSSQKGGIFSRLVQRFPLLFNILRSDPQLDNVHEDSSPKSTFSAKGMKSTKDEMPDVNSINGGAEGFDSGSLEFQPIFNDVTDATTILRNYGGTEKTNTEFPEATFFNELTEGHLTLQRELLIGHKRSGHDTAEEAANETKKSGANLALDNLKAYKLPVGVKPSQDMKDGSDDSKVVHYPEENSDSETKAETQFPISMSLDGYADVSLESLTDASARQNGVYPDVSKKNGRLSARAASMLEAERDSQKKWSPIMEIDYRGGTYVGRCQGGLPEGKGRLSLVDGSMYDGMWRYGKKSGLGTFCFSNGDVFRGSWRDDVMHGKGWFYFHTGDRWFVNFWKGKANGEGRFYSKNGNIFFGHFKNGWRDGQFLCIDVSGSRCVEIWDEGVLVSRKQLECDDAAGSNE